MLSPLQQYIVRQLLRKGASHPRQFCLYYQRYPKKTSREDQLTSIARSVDRLIERGLVTGWGRKTKEKWFIEKVKLTPAGLKKAKILRLQQLPFILK